MNRRGFLRGLLAIPVVAALAPLFPEPVRLRLWGDGYHDDTAALQALIDAQTATGKGVYRLPRGRFRITDAIRFPPTTREIHGGPTRLNNRPGTVFAIRRLEDEPE